MVHGYLHQIGTGNVLRKITVPTENNITGFLFFDLGNKQILSFYDIDHERFFFYNGIGNESTQLNRFNSFSNQHGKIKEILGRAVYRNTTAQVDNVNFVYFCLTTQNKIVKVLLRYNNLSDSYSMQVTATITLDSQTEYGKGDVLLKVYRHTDQYDLVTHDPAYSVYDTKKNKLYLYTVGISETRLYEYTPREENTDPLYVNGSKVEFPDISENMETKYMNELPIIVHDENNHIDKIVYVDFVNSIISRISFVSKLPFYESDEDIKDFTSSLKENGEIYTVSVATKNGNERKVISYEIDLRTKELKALKENKEKNNYHSLAVNLFFNGGDYIRQDGDKIKVMVRDFTPSLRGSNKSPILIKSLENTNIGFETENKRTNENTFIPRIFENENEIEELKKKDPSEVKFGNDYSKNKLINSLIGSNGFTELISDLNKLDEKIDDYDSLYFKGEKFIKVFKFSGTALQQLLYIAKNDGSGFDISLLSDIDTNEFKSAIAIENPNSLDAEKAIGHFSLVQKNGNTENITENVVPLFLSGDDMFKGYGIMSIDKTLKLVNLSLTKDTIDINGIFDTNAGVVANSILSSIVETKLAEEGISNKQEVIKDVADIFDTETQSNIQDEQSDEYLEDGSVK